MIPVASERSKRHRAKRDNDLWINDFDLAEQKVGAVRHLAVGWSTIGARTASRITKHCIGNKDVVTREFDGGDEPFKVAPGLVP